MLVGVHVEGNVADLFAQHFERISHVLPVLAVNGTGFRLEVGKFIVQVLETIAFDVDDLFQILGSEVQMEGGNVVIGEGICVSAKTGHNTVVHTSRILQRAPEHDMLKEVGKPGLPRFHFIAAPGPDHGIVGNETR